MTNETPDATGETILRTRTAHAGFANLLVATVRRSDGATIEREIEHHGDAVCVLPYNPRRRTAVLVRQVRAPVLFAAGEGETLEAVAGVMEREEDALACVRRETLEEAHLELGEVEPLFTAWTMPGVSTERMHFHLAVYDGAASLVRGGIADEHEETSVAEFGLAALARMAEGGEIADVKTLLLIQTLRLRAPSLFES